MCFSSLKCSKQNISVIARLRHVITMLNNRCHQIHHFSILLCMQTKFHYDHIYDNLLHSFDLVSKILCKTLQTTAPNGPIHERHLSAIVHRMIWKRDGHRTAWYLGRGPVPLGTPRHTPICRCCCEQYLRVQAAGSVHLSVGPTAFVEAVAFARTEPLAALPLFEVCFELTSIYVTGKTGSKLDYLSNKPFPWNRFDLTYPRYPNGVELYCLGSSGLGHLSGGSSLMRSEQNPLSSPSFQTPSATNPSTHSK